MWIHLFHSVKRICKEPCSFPRRFSLILHCALYPGDDSYVLILTELHKSSSCRLCNICLSRDGVHSAKGSMIHQQAVRMESLRARGGGGGDWMRSKINSSSLFFVALLISQGLSHDFQSVGPQLQIGLLGLRGGLRRWLYLEGDMSYVKFNSWLIMKQNLHSLTPAPMKLEKWLKST